MNILEFTLCRKDWNVIKDKNKTDVRKQQLEQITNFEIEIGWFYNNVDFFFHARRTIDEK